MKPLAAALCLCLCLALAACGTTYAVPDAGGPAVVAPVQGGSPRSPGDFARVAARVEPAAEAFCREAARGAPAGYCDFRVSLETDPRMPPNAFRVRWFRLTTSTSSRLRP